MAKKKVVKKTGRGNPNPKNQFKKGIVTNPAGRPKLTDAQKALRLKSRADFQELLANYMALTLSEIIELLKQDLPAIDVALLRHVKEMITGGSMERVDWSTNHVMGKQKETTNINLTGTMENTNSIDLKKLSKKELVALKALSEKGK